MSPTLRCCVVHSLNIIVCWNNYSSSRHPCIYRCSCLPRYSPLLVCTTNAVAATVVLYQQWYMVRPKGVPGIWILSSKRAVGLTAWMNGTIPHTLPTPITLIGGILSNVIFNPKYAQNVFEMTVAIDCLGYIVWICPLSPKMSADVLIWGSQKGHGPFPRLWGREPWWGIQRAHAYHHCKRGDPNTIIVDSESVGLSYCILGL